MERDDGRAGDRLLLGVGNQARERARGHALRKQRGWRWPARRTESGRCAPRNSHIAAFGKRSSNSPEN